MRKFLISIQLPATGLIRREPLSQKARADRYKANNRSRGLCTNCPAPVAIVDGKVRKLCLYHLAKQRAWGRAYHQRRGKQLRQERKREREVSR